MSRKLHFLNFFPENVDNLNEQAERFYQDTKSLETSYQGRRNVHMIADYCWSIKSNITFKNGIFENEHKK